MLRTLWCTWLGILLVVAGCDDPISVVDPPGAIPLRSLANWTRNPGTPIFGGKTGQFAGDPHVWEESPGHYRMVYTDSYIDGVNDYQAIAMATSTDLVNWSRIENSEFPAGIILQGVGPGGRDHHQETAFYRKASDGKHQIFYIGYESESTYHAAIYKAEATNIQGPYLRESEPVIAWTTGGVDAAAMTSPTIVTYEGALYMTYVGWAGYPDGPVVIVGATSTTDGRSWAKQGALSWNDIFGVEAHIERGPDGWFYRVGVVSDANGNDEFALGRASHPFGPYEVLPDPILTLGGASRGEVDSITSPSLIFVTGSQTAFMHYAAVAAGGFPWVISLATSTYGN